MPLRSRLNIEIPQVSVPSWLFQSPSANLPDIPIALDPQNPKERFLTLSSYRHYAQRFAAGLRANGLQTGDVVLYVSGNSLAFYAVFMGTLMAGGVFSGANPNMTVPQIAYQAEHTNCRFLLSSPQAYTNCVEALRGIDILADAVYVVDREPMFGAPSRYTLEVAHCNWIDLLGSPLQGQDFDWNEFCTDPEQLAALNYTSGSIGPPKGVMTSHRNHVANAVLWIGMQLEHPDEPTRGAKVSWVGFMPMIYIFAQSQFLLVGPKRGIRNYLMETFDLDAMIRYIETYRTTELHGTPSVAIGLDKSTFAKSADLTCLTSVQIGGAPLKRAICERLEKQLGHPGLFIKQGWGMTELTGVPLSRHPLDTSLSMSVGELLPNCEGKVLSIDGSSELGPNESGELFIKAPTITQGYWKNSKSTAGTFQSDGWLRTGDLAYYDEQGRWFVLDRLRELIVTSQGHQIIPSEVESMLLDIRGVTDAGVVSVAIDGQSAQEPRAFVVLDPQIGINVADVRKVLEEMLDEGKWMTAGIFPIEVIPRLPGAKIDRVALRSIVIPPA